MSTPEGKVKEVIKRLLKAAGWWYFMPVSNGLGKHGIPDIIACKPTVITPDMVGQRVGVFVGIECKAPGKLGTVTPLQERELKAIEAAGGIALLADNASYVAPLTNMS